MARFAIPVWPRSQPEIGKKIPVISRLPGRAEPGMTGSDSGIFKLQVTYCVPDLDLVRHLSRGLSPALVPVLDPATCPCHPDFFLGLSWASAAHAGLPLLWLLPLILDCRASLLRRVWVGDL